jgi:hypothetical protein
LGTRERQSRRATSTSELGGPGWRLSSAAAALTSFGVRGKRRESTSILEDAARTIPPPTPSHLPSPARATGQSLVPEARLGYARQSTARTKCKIQRFGFSRQPKHRGFVQTGQCLTRCCLTLAHTAAGVRLIQTLGVEGAGLHCSSRVSALRRELNSHDAANRERIAAAAIEGAGHPDEPRRLLRRIRGASGRT